MATVNSLSDVVVFTDSQGNSARASLVKASESTVVFELYNPHSIVQLSEILNDLEIRSTDGLLYRGRVVVSSLINTGLLFIVSADLLDPWSEQLPTLGSATNIRDQVTEFLNEWKSDQDIRPGYRLSVSRLRSFLTALNHWLEHLDFEQLPRGAAARSDDKLCPDLAEPLIPTLIELFGEFERQAAAVPERERVVHIRHAQGQLHPLLMRAPFVHRAYDKPLGYAGDFEMVNMMLRDAREGPTLYTQLINALYLQTGPAEAHRNRIDILVTWLLESIARLRKKNPAGRPKLLNIGCGPAIELQRLIRRNKAIDMCDLTLVDFSRETLDHTKARLNEAREASGSCPKTVFSHVSVQSLLRQAAKPEVTECSEQYDVIYCAGLFDYLSDRVCTRLLALFYQWCNAGGRIIVTNVHPSNPTRHWMEHLLEWYLIYRDEFDMQRMGTPFPRHRIFRDDTGINIFLEIEKPFSPDGA